MKTRIKFLARLICLIIVAPAVLGYRLQSVLFGAERVFPGWSQLFSLAPGTIGVYLRHAFFCCTLRQCDPDASVGFGTIFSDPRAAIGRTAYIGNYCSIGNVEIQQDVLIASHVSIMNGLSQHRTDRLDIPVREQAGSFEPVTIGADTWIGERATVAASAGRHCVVGAGAVVLAPLPDYAIAVGVPARIIGDRRDSVRSNRPSACEPVLH